jgi:hypothetical protein
MMYRCERPKIRKILNDFMDDYEWDTGASSIRGASSENDKGG